MARTMLRQHADDPAEPRGSTEGRGESAGSTVAGFAPGVLDQMSQAIAIFDKRPCLVYCNPAAVALLKLPPELRRPGTSFRRFMRYQVTQGAVMPRDIPKLMLGIQSKRPHRLEYRDSSGKFVSVRRDPLASGGFVVLYNDVTLQREAEAALRENERRYHAIVEDQTDLIARYKKDGSIAFVNSAFCHFHELSRAEIIGRNILDFVYPADREEVARRFHGPSGRKPLSLEHRSTVTAGGLPRWLLRSDRPIYGAKRTIVEYQCVMREVTELKRAHEHAQRVGKLTTLGQIVAGVTHELNQPLNAAAMAAQNALLELELTGSMDVGYMTRKLESFVDSIRAMGAIVNHLRTFIRSPNDVVSTADAGEVVRRSVGLVAQQLDFEAIGIAARVPETCPRLAAAPVDVEIVLVNLLTNARDAIKRRREADNAKGVRETPGRISIMVHEEPGGQHVLFHVRDNGGGVPNDLVPRVFDPFFTTKEVGEGMGLGLALVHQTAASFGGAVQVQNTKRGAEFRFSVPVAAKP